MSCLSVCFAVCMSYLSVCEHNLVLYFAVCIWAYGQNTIYIWSLKSLSVSACLSLCLCLSLSFPYPTFRAMQVRRAPLPFAKERLTGSLDPRQSKRLELPFPDARTMPPTLWGFLLRGIEWSPFAEAIDHVTLGNFCMLFFGHLSNIDRQCDFVPSRVYVVSAFRCLGRRVAGS